MNRIMMPGIVNGLETRTKRKTDIETKRVAPGNSTREADIDEEVLQLEEKILESRTNYNSIHTLLGYLQAPNNDVVAAVALCRVFSRLMAKGNLVKSRDADENEATIVQWLKERYQQYKTRLLYNIDRQDIARQSAALTLLMRLIKEESSHLNMSEDAIWRNGVFKKVLQVLTRNGAAEETRAEFVEKYVKKYDDIRYYTFARLADLASNDSSDVFVQNTLSILASIEAIPEKQEGIEDFYVSPPSKAKHDLHSLSAHKKQAQKAWVAILRRDLSKAQRKITLDLMSHRIAPWFLKTELLMDFLTDSFNVGGSTSLMALSGLFYLIRDKSLDYPQFYRKLYSLLDSHILHSKHRSHFFRLLDTFLASTHLPAALVASFIKRISRLTLHAPPSGVVFVVPWIYNLLKNHPSCTFMIHRNGEIDLEEEGWGDPFRMEEPDPMDTDALESSLWEINMLQSHYHPNVATIAKIISEQFRKQAYNLEDFLDHSYGTMLDMELSKDIKKALEIEYEIPKQIFTNYDADCGKENSLLVKLWDFS